MPPLCPEPRPNPETKRHSNGTLGFSREGVRWVRVLTCFTLACCAPPIEPLSHWEPYQRTPVTDSAAAIALGCGLAWNRRPVRDYEQLELWLDPLTPLADYAPGHHVVVQKGLEGYVRVWAHSLLHALMGIRGHPEPFTACGLWPL